MKVYFLRETSEPPGIGKVPDAVGSSSNEGTTDMASASVSVAQVATAELNEDRNEDAL